VQEDEYSTAMQVKLPLKAISAMTSPHMGQPCTPRPLLSILDMASGFNTGITRKRSVLPG